jgi:hypothetical protein
LRAASIPTHPAPQPASSVRSPGFGSPRSDTNFRIQRWCAKSGEAGSPLQPAAFLLNLETIESGASAAERRIAATAVPVHVATKCLVSFSQPSALSRST